MKYTTFKNITYTSKTVFSISDAQWELISTNIKIHFENSDNMKTASWNFMIHTQCINKQDKKNESLYTHSFCQTKH
jgi:hypothetical protein